MAGYKLAGGDTNLNNDLLWEIQALIALGFHESLIRLLDDKGVTISLLSEGDYYNRYGGKVVYWNRKGDIAQSADDPAWVAGFPALAILAHEFTHAIQDVGWSGLDGYGNGETEVAKAAEQQAMQTENSIAYMFYRRVPGYGKGGAHEIKGPRTFYRANGKSMMPPYENYDEATLAGMTWDEWEQIGAGYVPAY